MLSQVFYKTKRLMQIPVTFLKIFVIFVKLGLILGTYHEA